jgi:hypothetical protein
MQRALLIIALAALVTVSLIGCSSTDPTGSGTVQMTSQLDNATLSVIEDKSGDRVEARAGTITISRVRILISRMKFKEVSEDSSDARDVKTGPSILTFENNQTPVVFSSQVPVGTYSRVKLEKHKFSSSEAEQYANDADLGPFASPDRLSIIIEGIYDDGTPQAFEIQDDATENVWIDFAEPLEVKDGEQANIQVVFDADQVFQSNGAVLNPFNDNDRKDIFKNLKKAFRLQNR